MTPVAVRDARADDAADIERVARAGWAETYRGIFEPDRIEEFMAENYSPAALATAAERDPVSNDAHSLVAERDGAVVAFAESGA